MEKLLNEFSKTVCTKTLYNYIDKGLLIVINIDLPLRVRHRNKRKLYGISIDNRPEHINNRDEFGHWEIDTILGDIESAPVLLTPAERMTRKCHIVLINNKSKESVKKGLEHIKAQYASKTFEVFKSITSDNGYEFAELSLQMPETKIYYAHPYSSLESGTHEKQHSLIRRFFPK